MYVTRNYEYNNISSGCEIFITKKKKRVTGLYAPSPPLIAHPPVAATYSVCNGCYMVKTILFRSRYTVHNKYGRTSYPCIRNFLCFRVFPGGLSGLVRKRLINLYALLRGFFFFFTLIILHEPCTPPVSIIARVRQCQIYRWWCGAPTARGCWKFREF